MQFSDAQLEHLCHWIFERDAIRMRKEVLKRPKPWTDDVILQRNRFCNVRRMDDKVSRWLLDNWYAPLHKAKQRMLVTAATLARHINWPDTLQHLQHVKAWSVSKWKPDALVATLTDYQAAGHKVFTGAYIINGARGGSKVSQVVHVADTVWRSVPLVTDSMAAMHETLMQVDGIGSFMAGQIVADLRHTSVLAHATDAYTWAPRGPGSTRGMNRLLGRAKLHAGFTDADWQAHMVALWGTLLHNNVHRLAATVLRSRKCELMDLQNCLCEFDKYMRVLGGEGRARTRYAGLA